MDDKIKEQIAANISYLRRLSGCTQTEIAKAVHMERSCYARIEAGDSLPTADTLILLADFYEVSVDTILQLDTRKIVSDVLFSSRCNKQLHNLLDIFTQLSPENKRKLTTRAKQLALEEEIEAMQNRHFTR